MSADQGGKGLEPEDVAICTDVLDLMVGQARQQAPLECCGFLTGRDGRIDQAVPMTNAAASPTRFEVAPQDLFNFFRQLRGSPRRLMGIYHSHPASPAVPSQLDIDEFRYPEATYWIISLAQEPPSIRCWRWVRMGFREVNYRRERSSRLGR
ncbi:MAG TPA: M67 family metallopeptidase [Acidobacteriota bacterium]|nr:M67 family metallopeptidase [Acidobacteriota bacterium]